MILKSNCVIFVLSSIFGIISEGMFTLYEKKLKAIETDWN